MSVPQATSKTPAATSWRESQSSPSCRPVPLRASQPWMCQLRPQHSLCKLRSSVISSTDTAPGTSYREPNHIGLCENHIVMYITSKSVLINLSPVCWRRWAAGHLWALFLSAVWPAHCETPSVDLCDSCQPQTPPLRDRTEDDDAMCILYTIFPWMITQVTNNTRQNGHYTLIAH